MTATDDEIQAIGNALEAHGVYPTIGMCAEVRAAVEPLIAARTRADAFDDAAGRNDLMDAWWTAMGDDWPVPEHAPAWFLQELGRRARADALTEDDGSLIDHRFEPSYTGRVCDVMVMRDGHGDQCGRPHAEHDIRPLFQGFGVFKRDGLGT